MATSEKMKLEPGTIEHEVMTVVKKNPDLLGLEIREQFFKRKEMAVISNVLRKLRLAKILYSKGNTQAARWFLKKPRAKPKPAKEAKPTKAKAAPKKAKASTATTGKRATAKKIAKAWRDVGHVDDKKKRAAPKSPTTPTAPDPEKAVE